MGTFIELCIEQNPSKRPTATELLQHPFLCNLDDLKNKQCVTEFVYSEDEKTRIYQKMTRNDPILLSTIPESIKKGETHHSNTKSPAILSKKRYKNKIKKKYVSGTSVCSQDGGKISVKLKIHHDKESQKVKFEYDPKTENIGSVVREMVETLELDRSRESEIMTAIKSKLTDLEHSVSNSTPNSPRHTQKFSNIPSRANTQPPNTHNGHAQHHNDENLSYSEPTTAKETNASNNNPFHSELETTVSQFVEPTHFPKVFNSNGTAANIQSISNAAKSQINTQSAPVTPGHSPQSEKKNVVNNGYHSETDQNAAKNELPPKLVSDSLLDQIMALPRDTIKGRIIQFGGTFSDDDA